MHFASCSMSSNSIWKRKKERKKSELAGERIQRKKETKRDWISKFEWKMAAFIKLEDSPMFQKQVINIYIFGFRVLRKVSTPKIIWIWRRNHRTTLTVNSSVLSAFMCNTFNVEINIFSWQRALLACNRILDFELLCMYLLQD